MSTPSARAQIQAARLQRSAKRRQWRRDLLERAVAGETRQSIAEDQGVSLATIRRALARARAECPVDSHETFFAVQRERLERVAALAEARVAEGDLAATYVLLQLVPLLTEVHRRQGYGKTL